MYKDMTLDNPNEEVSIYPYLITLLDSSSVGKITSHCRRDTYNREERRLEISIGHILGGSNGTRLSRN